MTRKSDQSFDVERYGSEYETYKLASNLVQSEIRKALAGIPDSIQEVHSRAKHPDSVAEKLTRDGRSADIVNDLIGVRVITLYDNAVNSVVERLRKWFSEDETLFRNKTQQLDTHEVGYRGIHIFLRGFKAVDPPEVADLLRSAVVEVQVKSLAAHTWAEAEHTLRYKAGEGVPAEISRRFNSLAGALELVDRELNQIHLDIVSHVKYLREGYERGDGLSDQLSSLQLLATLALCCPRMRPQGPHELKLDIEDSFRLAKILCDLGIDTPKLLRDAINEPITTHTAVKYFELKNDETDPDYASAIIVLGAIIGTRNFSRVQGTLALSQDGNLLDAITESQT